MGTAETAETIPNNTEGPLMYNRNFLLNYCQLFKVTVTMSKHD